METIFPKKEKKQFQAVSSDLEVIKFIDREYKKSDWILGRTKELLKRFSIKQNYSFKNYDSYNSVMENIKEKLSNWNFKDPEVCSLLSNQTGIGKTHLAISLLKKFVYQYIENNFNNEKLYIEENGKSIYDPAIYFYYLPKVKFISFLTLANEVQNTFKEYSQFSEMDIINHYSKYDFLIIDDLFSLRKNDFTERIIFSILDNRINELKPTVITSNLFSNEMEFRIFSRINNSMLIEIKSELKDFRQLK